MYRLALIRAVVAGGALAASSGSLLSDTVYTQTNLASDLPGIAANLDPNLKNPWGAAFSNTSPFWVSNQVTNTSTLYNAAGVPQSLVVSTPPGPTGQVFNPTTDFALSAGNPSRFIFSSLSGTVSGWNSAVNSNSAVTRFSATDGAVYTGLAIGAVGSNNFLYVADARNGKVDVLNGSFQKTSLAGSFVDPNVPSGYTPYNIQNISGKLYVTYSRRDTPGGYVGVFDLNGNLLQHIADSHLDEPWGLTIAPSTFGSLGGTLLIGNLGNGQINGYDPNTGAFVGTLSGISGPIANDGLWALAFRGSGSGFDPNALYFFAGIDNEQHGLFGAITPTPEPGTMWTGGLLGLAFGVRLVRQKRTGPRFS